LGKPQWVETQGWCSDSLQQFLAFPPFSSPADNPDDDSGNRQLQLSPVIAAVPMMALALTALLVLGAVLMSLPYWTTPLPITHQGPGNGPRRSLQSSTGPAGATSASWGGSNSQPGNGAAAADGILGPHNGWGHGPAAAAKGGRPIAEGVEDGQEHHSSVQYRTPPPGLLAIPSTGPAPSERSLEVQQAGSGVPVGAPGSPRGLERKVSHVMGPTSPWIKGRSEFTFTDIRVSATDEPVRLLLRSCLRFRRNDSQESMLGCGTGRTNSSSSSHHEEHGLAGQAGSSNGNGGLHSSIDAEAGGLAVPLQHKGSPGVSSSKAAAYAVNGDGQDSRGGGGNGGTKPILCGISGRACTGQVLGILGPSGSGKVCE
jgi:hypothetical protein